MKWLPRRDLQRKDLEGKSPSDNLSKSTPLLVGLIVLVVGTGLFLSANASKLKSFFTPDSFSGSLKEINNVAANISVKVLDKEFLGSGFIVQKNGNQYAIVTNQHVLRAGEAPYNIQTPDGKVHSAEVVKDAIKSDYEYDLAMLQFTTDINYPVAKIGSSLYLEVGEPIYAAGFPYTEAESKTLSESVNSSSNSDKATGLTLKTGRIAIILNQALVEGYQIGDTNDVKKGMSG